MNGSRDCAACNKTVYPTEELRCLDKIWHKSCFRCAECRKILGIHNFKGFKGQPYCNVHYPQPKSYTHISDTPVMQQVAINTKNMSKVHYHRDYEVAKGRQSGAYDSQRSISQDAGSNHSLESPPVQTAQPNKISSNGSDSNNNGYSVPMQTSRDAWNSESYSYPAAQVNLNTGNDNNDYSVGKINGPSGTKTTTMESDGKSKTEAEEANDVLIYRPNLVMIGGMRVTGSGNHFQAVYNYEAAEDDEVSFVEGDEILHGEPIDEGWMFGTVRRTGKFGMLPSNYVIPLQTSTMDH